ncbi:aspartate--tRNA ligase [Rhodocaloribacter litoris]|uniref:aspartate--tRNA ligase n=1 Tax=Rhodocaloribacter litoris TaxID=2558931 RepID=UPI00141EFF2E|nr:aspartate--tRNA ligase [Rhodocaloribacter litoris]QXD16403.1 aspartate--tRNA ligase [Rhodocaloribacter litoris]
MSIQPRARLHIPQDTHGPRTHTCGALRREHVGQEVVLKGWVDTRRDLGGVIFIDLRDRYGLTQIVFSPQDDPEAHARAAPLRSEYVVSIRGTVALRAEETINPKLPTGDVEVRVHDLVVLNPSDPPPFTVSAHEEKQQKTSEDLRLRYRYLDLRRPELQRNLTLRHRLYQATRRYFDRHGFIEIETPVLMKSTPEGARDYLVPSRLHPGKFYALPQSPQTYKQILMVAGFDRYFQIVKCFRDEDLRADRQPEFTQIDVEVSFATEEMIYALMEGLMQAIWKETRGIDIATPFPRLRYDEALRTYGTDKPDTRFGLEIHDLSDVFRGSGFRVFDDILARGGHVVALNVPGYGDQGRGYMDRLDKDVVRRRIGAGGLIYFRLPSDGSPTLSSVKEHVLPTPYVDAAVQAVGARPGDLVLVLAGPAPTVFEQMGALRLHMGQELALIPPPGEGPWHFVWITDFPLLEWDEEERRFVARHHPFTSPHPEDLDSLFDDPARTRARAYDLVLNGYEIGGGSIRIHQPELQRQMFHLLGIDEAEARQRFGFLLDAFRYGAPPHGGIAFGVDRIAMLLAGGTSLRDVIAFPKTQRAQELMVQSPDTVDPRQLEELHIRIVLPEED